MAHPTHTPSDPAATSPAALAASLDKAHHPTPELAEAITRGYEPHDIGLKGLFTFLGVLIVSLVVVFAIIFAIMMALVAHDRAGDQIGSTLKATDVSRGPVYAPLQPSIDHPVLDADDMTAMRADTASVLNSKGSGENGRRYISINAAMEQVLPLLQVKAAPIQPVPTTPRLNLGDQAELRSRGYVMVGSGIEWAESHSSDPK